jgi:nucleoside-diphosphate-sugar epimerase
VIYGLTGHTSGIGRAISERLKWRVVGFSRSNGYDITNKDSRRTIIDESKDVDVFINNAQAGYAQVDMLIDIFMEWKDQTKKIINVGSTIVDHRLAANELYVLHYAAQKRALKSVIDDMQGYNCEVTYVQFGYVGTDRILQKYPNLRPDQYISVDEAVTAILGC